MKKSKILKNIIYILILLLVCVGIVFAYYYFTGQKNPLLSFVDNIGKNSEEINDNYNGIYTYKESLNGSKFIYNGCSVTNINYYLLIVNDTFYSYKGSCMGTYYLGEGKVSDLEILTTEDNRSYFIKYQDKEYLKDQTTRSLTLNNDIKKNLMNIDLNNYKLILNETEFAGNYYSIAAPVNGISSSIMFKFEPSDTGDFQISLTTNELINSRKLYEYNANNYDNLPDFYPYGKNIVVIEKNHLANKFSYKFKVVSTEGVIYELDKMFPITVDGVQLNPNNSVFVTFDQSSRIFRVLVGNDDKMCQENTDTDTNTITYYEFKITYSYSLNNFTPLEFVKIGYANEGCNYVNKILGR